MPKRTSCKWKRFDGPGRSVCEVCKGYLHIDGVDHCPYHMDGVPRAEFQHLITAEERYFTIQQLRKLKEYR
jgi:hypothetical protein